MGAALEGVNARAMGKILLGVRACSNSRQGAGTVHAHPSSVGEQTESAACLRASPLPTHPCARRLVPRLPSCAERSRPSYACRINQLHGARARGQAKKIKLALVSAPDVCSQNGCSSVRASSCVPEFPCGSSRCTGDSLIAQLQGHASRSGSARGRGLPCCVSLCVSGVESGGGGGGGGDESEGVQGPLPHSSQVCGRFEPGLPRCALPRPRRCQRLQLWAACCGLPHVAVLAVANTGRADPLPPAMHAWPHLH